MTLNLTRRRMLGALGTALAAPAILSFPTRAAAQSTLTLGHGAAPGNPLADYRRLTAAVLAMAQRPATHGPWRRLNSLNS